MRSLRRIRRGWVLVLVGAALSGVTILMGKMWLPAALAAGLAAAVAIVAGTWTSRGTSALTERDKLHHGLPGMILLIGRGRLPRVRELHDPVALGVHPAARRGGSDTRTPAFISRDVTEQLCEAVRRDRFVLLVGESTAGKTRAVYEAMRELFPDHRLIQPAGREAIPAAVQLVRETPASVLWLDDLERFLGADGLTGAAVNSILTLPDRTRYVLATMRAEEYSKHTGRPGHADNPGREAIRRGWDVLRLATRITLPRAWSPHELERAAKHRHDPRISEALEHSDRFGVAEYLAAGPQLLADWQDAWAPGTHPRAAALVLAAVDARRVGMHRPLPLTVLDRVHAHYLQQRGGHLLRPESLEDALAWATRPLHATSSLLLPAGDRTYLAFDYLIDAADKTPISPVVLSALLAEATAEEAMEIGEMAGGWHLLGAAQDAFNQAQQAGQVLGVVRRCHLILETYGCAAALQFAQHALAHYQATLGPEHRDTLIVADLVAWQTGHDGDPDKALHMLEQLLPQARRIIGDDHETTLEIRMGIAHWTGNVGDHARAVELYESVVADSARILGDDHRRTIDWREGIAYHIGKAGNPRRAADLLHTLLHDMEKQRQHPRDLWGIRYTMATYITEAEDHASALSLWAQLCRRCPKNLREKSLVDACRSRKTC